MPMTDYEHDGNKEKFLHVHVMDHSCKLRQPLAPVTNSIPVAARSLTVTVFLDYFSRFISSAVRFIKKS